MVGVSGSTENDLDNITNKLVRLLYIQGTRPKVKDPNTTRKSRSESGESSPYQTPQLATSR